jgi:hypothetical protein
MTRSDDPAGRPAITETDLRCLAAIAAWDAPGEWAEATESLSCEIDPQDLKSSVTGSYLAATAPLAAPEQINRAVQELRDLLSVYGAKGDDKKRGALLEAWIAVELCLHQDELRELRDTLFAALFPQSEAPAPSRGRTAQTGGN